MSRTGYVTLPNVNADIAATGVITTKGGISVKDSGGVEKISLSNSRSVTLPNASISVGGDISTNVLLRKVV